MKYHLKPPKTWYFLHLYDTGNISLVNLKTFMIQPSFCTLILAEWRVIMSLRVLVDNIMCGPLSIVGVGVQSARITKYTGQTEIQ